MYGLPQLMVIQRFSNLPVVKSSIDKATDIYVRVKKSNRLIQWSLQTAEATVTVAVDLSASTLPIVLFNGPIHLIDEILCKSLDMVEDAVPIIKQQPNEIYLEAKTYVSSVMEPVLKRADSVKEISLSYSNRAAESIDHVLTAADGIVDKYLPEINSGGVDAKDGPVAVFDPPRNPTQKTIRHVRKFSNTLTRRLTQRTIYEARALKNEGINVVHVLLTMTDMMARDPKQFVRRVKEVWNQLSLDEPENQVPPQNLDELIVMLTREGARRFVHVANFITYNTVKIPTYAHDYMKFALLKYSEYIDSLDLKSTGVKRQAEILKHAIQDIFDQFFNLIKPMLGYSSSGRDIDVSLAIVTTTRRSNKANKSAKPSKSAEHAKNAESKGIVGSKNEGNDGPNGAAVPVAK